MVSALWLCVVLLGAPGLTKEQLADVQGRIREATEHFQAERYAEALETIRRVEPLAAALGVGYQAAIQRNVARCLEQLGRPGEAATAYDAFVVLSARLPRRQRDRAREEEARTAAGRLRATGALAVRCQDAVVHGDGFDPPSLPCPALWRDVAPGTFRARVRSAAGVESTVSVTVTAGARTEVEAVLPAELTLAGLPRGAQLFVDGQRQGSEAPLRLRPGRHMIRVEAPGYERWERGLQLRAGTRTAEQVEARPLPAPAPAPEEPSPWPWALGGTGVAATGAGAFFLVSAAASYDDAEAATARHNASSDAAERAARRADAEAATADGESSASLGYALVGVGVAAVVGGVVWWLLE